MQENSVWNDGYYTSVDVYDGYIAELSPLNIDLNLSIAGFSLDSNEKIGEIKQYRYLELGYGRGTSLNIHAATSNATFIGTDFAPSHSLLASSFASASKADITIYNDSFAELESRLDSMYGAYPKEDDKFDYIVFHGIWSWINDENRDVLVRIAKKYAKCNRGGIVYNSYNCLHGWAAKMPAREVFKIYNEYATDSSFNKIDECINFFDELLKCNPMFSRINNQMDRFIRDIKAIPPQQKAYIAHEYLNEDWDMFYFRDVVKMMDRAKCKCLCSGRVIEHFDDFHISPEGINFLNNIKNKIFREQMKDYFTNKQFRIDLYAKAIRNITLQEARGKLLNTSFILISPTSSFDFKFDTARGVAEVSKEKYEKILDVLSSDSFKAKTLQDIMDSTKLDFSAAISSLMVLIHKGIASVAQDINDRILTQCKGFNDYLFKQQALQLSSLYVASPVIARGLTIIDTEQLFIKAYNELVRKDSKYVKNLGGEALDLYNRLLESSDDSKLLQSYITSYTFQTFRPQNRRHVKDGKILNTDKENKDEIGRIASFFIKEKLELYKALKIAGGGNFINCIFYNPINLFCLYYRTYKYRLDSIESIS
ncbi:hypothetical protein DCO58_07210 [Helicobacter saguini]|uniref:Methyltransferase regulatory domain-containing protein n=1 Tax=Helicobacter saguini TaxID=1548018 RepID=A0A347VN71_9HELI|nr:class I SAM-dependent methyltransferase [Helicobacter saguini]MWV61878.1 hypothetical protein [Helicobacter saguini]MWV67447.1 hypothetical protein [Helicobacter saguini]MWV69799.1 hypothetical protein [Helicobacter saguini]MWV72983.1 hypothetical protein [Helicobacter saguini]TLD95636.1 hypothetical protein LS64_001930 [Helicobacter saguini]